MKEKLMNLPCHPPKRTPIIEELLTLRQNILEKEKRSGAKWLKDVHPTHLKSARNLLHYLAFRNYDVRDLQLDLSEWGLSSLGRAERKVQATIDMVLHVLHHLNGEEWNPKEQPPVCFKDGRHLLEENTEKLLGPAPNGRRVRIMVTMPSEAAEKYDLVKELLSKGMNAARINCAHDHPEVWQKIIHNIRRAEDSTGRKCRILMDLGGPKLRTGPLEPQPPVLKVKPDRDVTGKVTSPALIWLYPDQANTITPGDAALALPMPAGWLEQVETGDWIRLTDARGSRRKLEVVKSGTTGCLLESEKTIYFYSGMVLEIDRKEIKSKKRKARLRVDLPREPGFILLQKDDLLLLTKSQENGHGVIYDEEGIFVKPATIGCTLPEVFKDVRPGEPVWFDDGKIGGVVEKASEELLLIRITQARPKGEKLRAEKGINLPETELSLRALTDQDKKDLEFVVRHADMVGLSFANRPDDMEELIQYMKSIQDNTPPVVLKIETRMGFDNMPAMLLTAMRSPVCGVMIARGDLAIETGFGRLAEVQEQMLWICEAAHVPVIWATQVLEGLAKQGQPSRAEVTDAAMGQRAECIMLNKGEHIVEATAALKEILLRMQDHQTKKRSLLRKLHLAEKFFKQPLPAESVELLEMEMA